MEEVTPELVAAWEGGMQRVLNDPVEAGRRYRRIARPGAMLARPPRPWCMVVRASDTRLMEYAGVVRDLEAARRREAHGVVLDGYVIRALCRAVRLEYPGVPIAEAARRLGRTEDVLRGWLPVRPGCTRAARRKTAEETGLGSMRWYQAEADLPGTLNQKVLSVRYQPGSTMSWGRPGQCVPFVWSSGPLNPGEDSGVPPHRVWGNDWQDLGEKLPLSFEAELVREPRWVRIKGALQFKGWVWRCPGRLSAGPGGTVVPGRCGRRVDKLFAPVPVWTVGSWLDERREVRVVCEGLAEDTYWVPGRYDPLRGLRSLACKRCWRVASTIHTVDDGRVAWNQVVGHLTGGLLYGREVEAPAWLGSERRRPRYRRRSRKHSTITPVGGARG